MRILKRLKKQQGVDPFEWIYRNNLWGSDKSVSGTGSDLFQTRNVRTYLPDLFSRLEISSVLDAPCGDLNWMKEVNLGVKYIGVDSVEALIESNRLTFQGTDRTFESIDLRRDVPPRADLILARDLLVHLSYSDISSVVANFTASGATWLLTTTFPGGRQNKDITTGRWRPLDLTQEPFSWPAPVEIFEEGCTEVRGKYSDKSLGLWRLNELPV